jgi:hypothetical protein
MRNASDCRWIKHTIPSRVFNVARGRQFYVDDGKLTQPLIPGLAVSNEIDAAFAGFDRQRNGAFILLADGFFRNQSEPLIKLAARQ